MAALLSYALTNVSDVKESLGIASSNTQYDNLIIRKINQATLAIEAYCGRRFKQTDYTDELYYGTNTSQIVLKNRPVVGTPTVEIRDSTLNEANFETIESTLLFTDANSGVLDLNFRAIGAAGRYAVTYTAGYSTIPEDLAEACASLAAYYVNNADGTDVGIASKKEGQREVRYSNASVNFKSLMENLGIDEIINSYANNPVMFNRT